MRKKMFVFVLLGALLFPQHAHPEVKPEIDASIREFVQHVVYASLLKTTSRIIEDAIKNNELSILPPVAFHAIQQTVLHAFKHETTKKTIQDVYEQGVDFGIRQVENGGEQTQIQNGIKTLVDRELNAVIESPIYRRILEEMLKHAYSETRRIMVMQVAQRKAQLMVIQQQQRAMQQAILRQYQQAIQQQVSQAVRQQINQQVTSTYEKQVNQLQAQDALYRQQLLQQQQQQQQQRSSGGLY